MLEYDERRLPSPNVFSMLFFRDSEIERRVRYMETGCGPEAGEWKLQG